MMLDRIGYVLSKNYGDKTFIAKSGTAPAAGLRSILGIDNAETAYSSKALFDATVPSTQNYSDAASVGTAMTAARRDHKHAMPAAYAHPSGDGNLHVPANSTTNAGKVLTAGAVAGTYTWEDLYAYTAVNGSGTGSDTYACDIGSAKIKRFSFTIADTDAKVVTFSNVPTGRCEVELEITTSAEASVTWTLNSGTINWQGRSAPILPDGMIHRIKFLTSDSGTTWQAYVSAGIMT